MDPNGYVNCDCSSCTGIESESERDDNNNRHSKSKRSTKKKRHIFPEILADYLRENSYEKFGVRWCKHTIQQPPMTLDCIQVDWDILLKVHTSVKNRQNLVKSFTNWKFVRISESPELWFCNQLDEHGRSFFRPDDSQITKLMKITNENGTPIRSIEMYNNQTKGKKVVLEPEYCLKELVLPLITSKLQDLDRTIWQQCMILTGSESYNEVPFSSFKTALNLVCSQMYLQFPENEAYLFLGSRNAMGEPVVTIDALSRFTRNFGPWDRIAYSMANFIQEGARNWYHGTISDLEVIDILHSYKLGSFLVRNRIADDANFSLEYRDSQQQLMSVLIQKDNGYKVLVKQDEVIIFGTLNELISAAVNIFAYPIPKASFVDKMEDFSAPSTPGTPSSMLSPVPSSPIPGPNAFVLKVKMPQDQYYKELRFDTQPMYMIILVEYVKRKFGIPPYKSFKVIKDDNVEVDDDNVGSLKYQQELLVVLR